MATFCTVAVISVILFLEPALSIPTDGENTTLVASTPITVPNTTAKALTLDQGKVDHNQTEIHDVGVPDEGWEYENQTVVDTRRILYGRKVAKGKRAYMVYLQLTQDSAKAKKYRGWLCGGVIVHPSYVLTSAACVEDADRFYVVSGTTQFVDSVDFKNNSCICNNRRKVVWKCIPKNYKFDFQDSIKWSSNDIAIVKVNKPFKFGVVEQGCDFATDLISYNNISRELEQPGTKAWIAGWGSVGNFREGVYRKQQGGPSKGPQNSKCLQEAKVMVMDNKLCARKWAAKFRTIIEQYMICTKDVMTRLSEICDKKYANCTDVDDQARRRAEIDVELNNTRSDVDLGRHLLHPDDYSARRASLQGGFCENDHGGPLIVKYQGKERAVGVISACKIDPKSQSCHGPFLYTSVFKNRQFLSCAINKDVEASCRRVFRTGITHEEWTVDWSGVNDDGDLEGEPRKGTQEVDYSETDEDKDALRNKNTEGKKHKSAEVASHEESKNKPAHEDQEKKLKPNKKKNIKSKAETEHPAPTTEVTSSEEEAKKTSVKKEKKEKNKELRADDGNSSDEKVDDPIDSV